MCASTEAKIRDNAVHVGLGYYGGTISIGNLDYWHDDKTSPNTKDEIIECLGRFKKSELIALIVDLVEGSLEE